MDKNYLQQIKIARRNPNLLKKSSLNHKMGFIEILKFLEVLTLSSRGKWYNVNEEYSLINNRAEPRSWCSLF